MPDVALDTLSIEAFAARWTQILRQAERSNLVAEAGGQVVGFASFGPSRDAGAVPRRSAELYGLYLDPHIWGCGVGYALWSAALQELREEEYAEVTLWVLEVNTRARTFYERVGFHLEPGVTRVLEREGAVLPEVHYRRSLA
jgi:GNAT superfamily N-acetyltransferase